MVSVGGGEATLATGDRVAELETLSVAEDERGRGVGRALMDAAYAVMRELGAGEVMLYVLDGNEDAMRFYDGFGLKPYLHVMLGTVPPNVSGWLRKKRQNSGTSWSGNLWRMPPIIPKAQDGGAGGRPA